MEEMNNVEQDIKIELEMMRIARSKDASTLRARAIKLCGLYNVESTSPTVDEVKDDLLDLIESNMELKYEDQEMKEMLVPILEKALTACDPLSIPMS